MIYTQHINNWESFIYVTQDEPGYMITTGGGLYTANLSNCMCLIVTNEKGSYGMLHVSPGHGKTKEWVISLKKQVAATTAIVTGANGSQQTEQRMDELVSLLEGLAVVDETRYGWVPTELKPIRGSNKLSVGYVAVNAKTGEYALSPMSFAPSAKQIPTAKKARRNSADGGCVII